MPPRAELIEQNLQHLELHANDDEQAKGLTNNNAAPTNKSGVKNTSEQSVDTETSANNNNVETYKVKIVWRNVILMSMLHIGALIGLRQAFVSAQWKTLVFSFVLYQCAGLGITAGAHRLWAHRSYKAKLPLRIILAIFQSLAFENSIYEWSRDHRVHHKYSETDADPHNATRGFFFSHMGWLLCRKHPDVITYGKQIDVGDLNADPVVRFQRHNYLLSVILFCFVLPTLIPYFFWQETLFNSFYICALFRYAFGLHVTWLVNSAAHMWGRRPYDKTINPSENRGVSLLAMGEGFHNYHHTFPWDYATSELGYDLNITKAFIDFAAWLGWAYERKVVTPEMIKQRKLRTGDTSQLGPYGPHNY